MSAEGENTDVGAVAALVVSHDGMRWLPVVVDGLQGQSRPPEHVLCVDTGSRDGSAELLEETFGPVARMPRETSYPEAVRRGLSMLADDVEWVWLLHDDSAPAPDALLALTLGTQEFPDADLLGCKHREFPSLRRLLEVGVTLSGTGRRETGLERGEYDQGQHDDPRRVLAVNTAGLLVRRSALEELGGLDARLPVFGSDLDLGWRAAANGRTTVVVPQAVVFHAEAAHRGLRRTPLTGRHTHFAERRAALFVLLANSPGGWRLPLQLVRLTLGTLLRVLGFLLVRSPGEALDELAALLATVAQPRSMRAARRERKPLATAPVAEVRALLPPPWLPYRHGLDVVGDLVAALFRSAADVAERRREAAALADPSSFAARRLAAERAEEDEDVVGADSGLVARFLANPVAVLLGLLVLALVAAAHQAFGTLTGGGLAPAPETWHEWWVLWTRAEHDLGTGTSVPAPALVGPLLWFAAVLGGSPAVAVSVVLVLAAPVGLWGAWRFLRVTGRLVRPQGLPRWMLLVGSSAWALVPAASGAWSDGRLGAVLAGALLPWLAHAALGFADPEADRRRRAAWRTGLLLAAVTAAAPLIWAVAAVLVLALTLAGLRLAPSLVRTRSVWGPVATALGVPLLVLLPWWLPTLVSLGPAALLMDPGVQPSPAPTGLDLLLGRLTDTAWPVAAGVVLPVLAVVALLPSRTRAAVAACWAVAAAAVLVALAASPVSIALAGGSTPAGLSGPLLVVQASLVVAACLGGLGALLHQEDEHDHGLVGSGRVGTIGIAVVGVLAALVPVTGLAWFLTGSDELGDESSSVVPAYMVVPDADGEVPAVLLLQGSVAEGLSYEVRRGGTATIGTSEVLALTPSDPATTRLVRDLVSRPTEADVAELGDLGITYVVLSAADETGTRADRRVASVLDAAAGLSQASSDGRTTRAWKVDDVSGDDAAVDATSAGRWTLVVLGVLGVLAALLGALPSRPGGPRGRRGPVDGEDLDGAAGRAAPRRSLSRRSRRRAQATDGTRGSAA
ncbi:glycosyltransferase family 2 protein [Nocardioides sp. GY 10127]|uniref:glycosyltransferase family 2 protein n=1 Tax=Nocardioides sp. GY 10127 TaxID=2569762 RepID=UPI0010A7F643|nr:glycosyltransferase family 2 protein [Nocardioides sp. GY 10127]TIC84229.1 glycosyltransferase family 2 protein [Nocardioides sp. GY 10127]